MMRRGSHASIAKRRVPHLQAARQQMMRQQQAVAAQREEALVAAAAEAASGEFSDPRAKQARDQRNSVMRMLDWEPLLDRFVYDDRTGTLHTKGEGGGGVCVCVCVCVRACAC
jgi:hypothetical protein